VIEDRGSDIVVAEGRLPTAELKRLLARFFEDMVGNRSMTVEDPDVRERVQKLTFELLGEGEPLA
jgi:hypothetical protein